ncbi:MAG TPA: hypothetical protein VK993_14655 [Chthoniobacterales bacterium]|nr:hypothetical protein [Chthoniobacterales bacterium]
MERSHVYLYGNVIKFALGGDWERFATTGWHRGNTEEREWVWTEGLAASMQFRVRRSPVPIVLKLKMHGYTFPPRLVTQPTAVFVNSIKIADWEVADLAEYRATIPTELVSSDTLLVVDLFTPKAVSPAFAGNSNDIRRLGLCVWEASIVQDPNAEPSVGADAIAASQNRGRPTSLNMLINCGIGGGSAPYLTSGWSHPEANFTWSDGPSATVTFQIPETTAPLTFTAGLGGLRVDPILPFQPTEVYANGRKIADWEVGAAADFSVRIPPDVAKQGGTLKIEFRMPKAASPKSLRSGGDTRVLGIHCYTLQLQLGSS